MEEAEAYRVERDGLSSVSLDKAHVHAHNKHPEETRQTLPAASDNHPGTPTTWYHSCIASCQPELHCRLSRSNTTAA